MTTFTFVLHHTLEKNTRTARVTGNYYPEVYSYAAITTITSLYTASLHFSQQITTRS